MFTGIVEEVGKLRELSGERLVVYARQVLAGTKPGDSLAVNGACLTVTSLTRDTFSVQVMAETLCRTNLGQLRPGAPVNLERALTPSGRLGGHLVQGHVDGTGKLLSLAPEAGAVLARFSAPPELGRYIVEKGFIAVDGVSLTVVACDAISFTVSLVAYTRLNTNLGMKNIGDSVNLEVDILAKYVERLLSLTGQGDALRQAQGITLNFLAEHGFVTSQPGR